MDLGSTTLADGKIWVGQTTTPTAVTPAGDVTMTNAGSFKVTQAQGTPISATTPTTAGQTLRFNGTSWTPNFISMADLRSTITGASALTSCTSGQTLTWSAATDNLACTNISVTASNFGSQTANTILAAPNGSAGTPTFRTLASTDLPSGVVTTGTYKSVTVDTYGRVTAGTNPTTAAGYGITDAFINGGNSFGGAATLGTNDNNTLGFKTNGVVNMTMLANGNVGMGTSTPASTLQVAGGVQVGTDAATCNATKAGTVRYNAGNMEYCNGSLWTIMGAPNSASPSFFVHKNGVDQTVTSTAYSKLTWSTKLFDTNNNFASDRFTPTVAGRYVITLNVYCNNATTYCHPVIYKNGSAYAGTVGAGSGNTGNSITSIVDMNGSTDYIEGWVYDYGTNVYGGMPWTSFSGTLVVGSTTASNGSGTANYVPLWSNATTLGNSPIAVSGSNVGIGTTTPGESLTVGASTATGNIKIGGRGAFALAAEAACLASGANGRTLMWSAGTSQTCAQACAALTCGGAATCNFGWSVWGGDTHYQYGTECSSADPSVGQGISGKYCCCTSNCAQQLYAN